MRNPNWLDNERISLPAVALGTFGRPGCGAFVALLVDRHVVPVEAVPGMSDLRGATMLDLFEQWDGRWPLLAREIPSVLSARTPGVLDLGEVTPLLPIRPRQILCAGANYRRHVIDMMADHDVGSPSGLTPQERRHLAIRTMDHRTTSGRPFAFVKPVSALLGPDEDLVIPADCTQPDWELELAIVIGRTCYRVDRANALDCVAGYTIANDISARDRLARRDIPSLGLDWVAGKSAPGFLPLGPWIVPSASIPRPQELMMTLKLNGEVMQHESTAAMIFPIELLIEHISTYMRLLPGDVICTGSPAGNGTSHGRFLRAGDVLQGHIEGLGTQYVHCVGEVAPAGAPTHSPFVPLPEAADQ